jgi:hypothetical protein
MYFNGFQPVELFITDGWFVKKNRLYFFDKEDVVCDKFDSDSKVTLDFYLDEDVFIAESERVVEEKNVNGIKCVVSAGCKIYKEELIWPVDIFIVSIASGKKRNKNILEFSCAFRDLSRLKCFLSKFFHEFTYGKVYNFEESGLAVGFSYVFDDVGVDYEIVFED